MTTTSDCPPDIDLLVCPGEVACVLGETGYEWTQPQEITDRWQVTVNDPRGPRCDLTATIIQGGVEVCGLLATWDKALSPRSRAALTRFLVAAQARVRFTRFTLHDREANVVSFAAAQRLDVELPNNVAAVAAACRLAWREVRALADDAVAQAYLEAAY